MTWKDLSAPSRRVPPKTNDGADVAQRTARLKPLAVGIVATRLRKLPAVLYWSVAVAIAGAVPAILSASAVRSGPNAGMVGAVVFGAPFYGVPTLAGFVVTRRFFATSSVTAVVVAGLATSSLASSPFRLRLLRAF